MAAMYGIPLIFVLVFCRSNWLQYRFSKSPPILRARNISSVKQKQFLFRSFYKESLRLLRSILQVLHDAPSVRRLLHSRVRGACRYMVSDDCGMYVVPDVAIAQGFDFHIIYLLG